VKRNKVRCWEFPVDNSESIYAAYPEDNSGYDLVSCLKCGQIYSISVVEEVYQEINRDDFVKNKTCINCGETLSNSMAEYPENYLGNDGHIHKWHRPTEYPDFDSVVNELPDLFSL